MNNERPRIMIYRSVDYMHEYPAQIVRYVDGEPEHLGEKGWDGVKDGKYYPPSLLLKEHELQKIADDLWAIGIRPSGSEGSIGQLDAVNRHLDDMRKIASKKLGIAL